MSERVRRLKWEYLIQSSCSFIEFLPCGIYQRGRITGKLALVPGQKTYGGIVQTVALTVKDEGLLALYRGATPTLLGAVPYEGIKFGTVGVLEWWFPLEANEDGSLPKPTPLRKMLFGGLGGVMAGLLTYPNDTVVSFVDTTNR